MIDSLENDQKAQELLVRILLELSSCPEYSLQEGILRKGSRIYLGSQGDLRAKIMEKIHSSPEGGHSGVTASIRKAEVICYWPTLRKDLTEWIANCEVCQRSKGEHVPTPGLLQPIPIPNQAWEVITMDFIEGLPKSEGKDTILVVVDKITKGCYLIALTHPFTATQVAQVVQIELPQTNKIGELRLVPVVVLDRRLVKKRNRQTTTVLIQWSRSILEDATWEEWSQITEKYPEFNPWG